jgi:hypothetical protein
MQSVHRQCTLFTHWRSCPEIVEIPQRALIAHQTPILSSWSWSSWINPWFSVLQYWLCWEFTSPHNENQASSEKKLTVDQLFHCVQTEETNYKNVFLQPDDIPSKHELPLSYTVTAATILWTFMQTFRNTNLWSWQIFHDIFQQTHIWNTAALKTDTVQQCTWVEGCCCITEVLRNAFASNKPNDSVITNSWSYTPIWKQCHKPYMAV